MSDTILTVGGRYVRPLFLSREDVQVADVAHALGNLCRFTGHTRVFYSVAEHSVRVSREVERMGLGPAAQLLGLIHDASEAYLCDLPSPLKRSDDMEAYREAERFAQQTCELALIPRPVFPGIPHRAEAGRAVKRADRVLLATERRDLLPPDDTDEWGELPDPLVERIGETLAPAVARDRFLEHYHGLRRQLPEADRG